MDFFSSIGIIFKFLTVFYLFLTIVPILTPILNSVFFACLIKIILISLIYYYLFSFSDSCSPHFLNTRSGHPVVFYEKGVL